MSEVLKLNTNSLWATEKHKKTALSFEIKEVLFQKQSKYQKVEIFETFDWGRILMLDGLMMVTEKDEFFYHETIVHVPMALKSTAKNILVIGGGDGGTVRELLKYDSIERIDMVEIDQMVVDASKQFLPTLSCGLEDARVFLKYEDAAEFIKNAESETYDLIISDSSDPEGFAASLIESEFYTNVKRTLTKNGLFIAQSGSPLSQSQELNKTWKNLNTVFANCKIAWSLTPTYPGSWWSFVIASKEAIDTNIEGEYQPSNCKFWKPIYLQSLLSVPNLINEVLSS